MLRFMPISVSVFLIGILKVSSLMLSLVGVQLGGGVKDIITIVSDTVYVVADFGVATSKESTVLIFHEFLEAISTQHFVFLVVTFMFLHISLVLECKFTSWPQTVKMCCSLPIESTCLGPTILGGSESLEPL